MIEELFPRAALPPSHARTGTTAGDRPSRSRPAQAEGPVADRVYVFGAAGRPGGNREDRSSRCRSKEKRLDAVQTLGRDLQGCRTQQLRRPQRLPALLLEPIYLIEVPEPNHLGRFPQPLLGGCLTLLILVLNQIREEPASVPAEQLG